MKKFLFKISLYIIGVLLIFGVLGSFADGNTDDNYMHFAVKKPQNIVLGDSRGAQAVLPELLNQKLGKEFDNFSLNVVQSPYGGIYYKALQRKLDPETKNGLFIVTVDPWNVSLDKNIKKESDFPEEHSPLKNMHFYDLSPNYEYLLKNYSRSWFKLYTEREAAGKSSTYLHKDGWMEVSVNMEKDSVAKREIEKVNFYRDLAKKQHISPTRIKALQDIIAFLKSKGTVCLVRIPASEKIMEIEKTYSPEFSETMKQISLKHGIHFFDFSSKGNEYQYTDGNHMYKESGKVFTAQIADSILAKTKNLK